MDHHGSRKHGVQSADAVSHEFVYALRAKLHSIQHDGVVNTPLREREVVSGPDPARVSRNHTGTIGPGSPEKEALVGIGEGSAVPVVEEGPQLKDFRSLGNRG